MAKYSPWGPIQDTTEITEGVSFVSTAGHGGLKLDRKRNAEMPEALRRKGGWYEEDCEYSLVMVGLPQYFKPEEVARAHQTAKNWFPDEYEAFTGTIIPLNESYIKQERQFAIDHANDYVVVAAWGDWNKAVPKGMVGVAACKGGDRNTERRCFLVPDDEYKTRSHFGFVIDTARHQPIDEATLTNFALTRTA